MNARPLSWWASGLLRRVLTSEQYDEVVGDLTERIHNGAGSRWRAACLTATVVGSVVWHTTTEAVRQRWQRRAIGGSVLPSVADFRLALRRWKARPALALSAVITLALGLAATITVFSILDTVVLRGLPWPEPDRLYNVYVARPHWKKDPVLSHTWNRGGLSWTSFQDIPRKATTIDGFGVWRSDSQTLGGSQAELVPVMLVNAGLFPMLRVVPRQGRFFMAEEDEAMSDSVVVSHETWKSRFGQRPDIIGQPVFLNETPLRIVGVLPAGFRFGAIERPEFLRPLGRIPAAQRGDNHFLQAAVRLAPGVTVDAATSDLDPWVRGSEQPDRKQATLAPHVEEQVGSSRRPLVTLLVAALLLLLIATSNAGALLLGDAETRRHEFAVRTALGSRSWHVRRQLAVEALVLGGAAAIGAVGLAVWALPVLIAIAPVAMPGLDTVSLDWRILGFAAVLTCIVITLLGVMPLWSLERCRGAEALREGGRHGALTRARGLRWIVAAQTALALILVVGAGLLAETVRQKTSIGLGFDADRLAVATVRLPPIAGATPEQRAQRVQALVDRVAALPGIEAATAASAAPFSNNNNSSSGLRIPARPDVRPNASRHIVTEHYFQVMGIAPAKGRLFDSTDRPGSFAAVVTEEFERTFMDGNAVGQTFILNDSAHTIIGVVSSPKHRGYTEEAWRGFYLLSRQVPSWELRTVLVRAQGHPSRLLPELRRAITALEPGAAFSFLDTMETLLARSIVEERFRAQLACGFGLLALLLATIGLYGVVARAVQARTRELGVRLALGARPGAISALVFRHALGLGALGILVGLPAALVASKAIGAFLYGVAPWSPLVITAAASTVLIAATAAALGPAIRASRIDPLRALRE